MKDKLSSIVYISVPENMNHEIGEFKIDPTILLPVEMPQNQKEWSIGELQWEQIIAGCLKVIAHDDENEHINYYRQFVLAAKPDIIAELSQTGVIKARSKDFDLAEEIFLSLCKLAPYEQSSFLNLALLYEERAALQLSLGNPELQEKYLQQTLAIYNYVVGMDEVIPEIHLNYGFFKLHRNDFDGALSQFEEYLGKSPEENERTKEVENLVNKLKQQNQLDESFKEAYELIRNGKEDRGIEKINQFLEHNPHVWNAWFLLGWAHRRKSRFEEGIKAFTQAITEGSNSTDTLNELAICLIETNKFKEAGDYLSQAYKMEPENIKIISNLGILAVKQNKTDEAITYFKSVLDIAPDDVIALKYLETLES